MPKDHSANALQTQVNAEPFAVSAGSPVALTVMESETQLSKTLSVSSAGKVLKEGSTKMHRGTAHRLTLSGTPTDQLAQLAYRMDLMTSREALVCAAPPDGQDAWPIVAKEEMQSNPGAVARTADTFKARPGPALFCLDFDTAEFPASFLARLREAGSISNALAEVHPALAQAAELSRASVSSGILLDGAPQPASGQHRYYIASDGLQVAAFVDILAARMKLAGFLWGKIAVTGAVLPRTLFDVDASKAASRLFYEADAVLADSRLSYMPGARNPTVRPGGVLDVADIAPLTAEEKERLAAMEAALRLSLEPEAAAQRRTYETDRIAKLVAQGKSPEAAQRAVSAAVERHELTGDFEILLDSGGSVTVRDILRAPSSFHRQKCADPLEPDYNGGRNIAVIFADGNAVRINSRAHGGMDYWLVAEPTEHFEVIDTPPDTSEHEPKPAPPRPGLFFDASTLAGTEAPAREWVVKDLVPSGVVTLFSGDGGTGKSLLALQLAVAVASGTQWIGMDAKPGTAVFLSAEDDRDELHRRLSSVARASGVDVADLSNLKLSSLAGEDALLAALQGTAIIATRLYAEIDAYLSTVGPTLVVLDTSADLFGGNENDRAQVRRFIGLLGHLAIKHQCAVMLLSHPSNAGMATGTGLSGSTAWNGSVRSRLYMERVKIEGYEADPNLRRLSNKKANYGPTGQELMLRWRAGVFTYGGTTAEQADEVSGKAEQVFLKLLDMFTAQGRNVNHAGGPTYAPKKMAEAGAAAEGITQRAFKVAMESLLNDKMSIRVAVKGPASKQRQYLERVK